MPYSISFAFQDSLQLREGGGLLGEWEVGSEWRGGELHSMRDDENRRRWIEIHYHLSTDTNTSHNKEPNESGERH